MIENDQTKNMARPFVVIAAVRSGGTFLAHCLSSHPAVFCDRGESLHQSSVWFTQIQTTRPILLHCLTHMAGYQASGCKALYHQAFKEDVWTYLLKQQPATIWIRRENLIRQAVSVILNKLARKGAIARPQHSFQDVAPARITLNPGHVLGQARNLRSLDEFAAGRMTQMKQVLALTYAQIVGGERQYAQALPDQATATLGAFLGVNFRVLRCDLTPINGARLSETLENWPEVRAAIRDSEFASLLSDEGEE